MLALNDFRGSYVLFLNYYVQNKFMEDWVRRNLTRRDILGLMGLVLGGNFYSIFNLI